MHLAYFDENKYADDNPFFFIGGFLIPDRKAIELEKTLRQIPNARVPVGVDASVGTIL